MNLRQLTVLKKFHEHEFFAFQIWQKSVSPLHRLMTNSPSFPLLINSMLWFQLLDRLFSQPNLVFNFCFPASF